MDGTYMQQLYAFIEASQNACNSMILKSAGRQNQRIDIADNDLSNSRHFIHPSEEIGVPIHPK